MSRTTEGLWGELVERYGRKPPKNILIAVLKHHSVEVDEEASEDNDKYIVVMDEYSIPKEHRHVSVREPKKLPANLKSVMEFLGY